MYDIPKSFYKALEDRFRGSRDEIRNRLQVYIPLLNAAIPLNPHGKPAALDIGCGRGEWLELLNSNGWSASGVDLDLEMVEFCQSLGLQAALVDGIEHLAKAGDASLDLISGFHIVEHIPIGHVLALLREANRVLKPAGIAIFESPNPENVQVGAHRFYLDPTHQRPIPPMLLQFMAEYSGFSGAEILRLHPAPSPLKDRNDRIARATESLWGPQDYSVVLSKSPPQAAAISRFVQACARNSG